MKSIVRKLCSNEPYLLMADGKDSLTVYDSMSTEGSHLLNGCLNESRTTVNLEEGAEIRS